MASQVEELRFIVFLREAEVRARARQRAGAKGVTIEEELSREARQRRARYDIFLSQTIRDAEIVLGVYDVLTQAGYTVFCDWIDDPETDRSRVTPANAAFVRATMGVTLKAQPNLYGCVGSWAGSMVVVGLSRGYLFWPKASNTIEAASFSVCTPILSLMARDASRWCDR